MVKLDPSTGIRLKVDARRADAAGPEAINLDMEFAAEGGEGPTPYEVLLHAAMVGQSTRFTRQDGVEEAWRIMQPLLDAPPPVHGYAPGSWGPAAAEELVASHGGWHGPWIDVVNAQPARSPQEQSAAAPSPFPPIADYAFLSNCHTGALVAPDGGIGWLCVPRFDSPSVFGTLLDRQAGYFRLAPFGINHPTARVYEPGTNVLTTTWKTPSGWVVVRDALTMGPREREDVITPHTRPPADDDGDHLLVRTVTCLEGTVEIELVCEPVFDYGRTPAEWTLVDGSRHTADATGAGQTIRLQTDLALGVEGDTGPRPARPLGWRGVLLRPVVGRGAGRTCRPRGGQPQDSTPPRGSGAPGWDGPGCPTTAGATRSSARRWPSRALPTCQPGPPSPR